MKPTLADASAILAFLDFEPGGEIVGEHLAEINVTAVNLAEIVTVLTLRGIKQDWIKKRVLQVFDNIVPFDRELASLAGSLVQVTKKYGLSLGDRSCLAAGIVMNARVLTADNAWKKVDLDIEIMMIR